MKKKYFFFDIDRTLGLDITSIIPTDTLYCLRQLQRRGHFISIASGPAVCRPLRRAGSSVGRRQ